MVAFTESPACHKQANNDLLEKLEAILLCMPQVPHEMRHSFAPGIYAREIKMFKGTTLIGHPHKTEHFNFVMTGKATVVMDGETVDVVAPCYFVSGIGVRKVLHIHEDMTWVTIHTNPDEKRDTKELFEMLAEPTETFKSFSRMLRDNGMESEAKRFEPIKEEVT